VLVNLQRRYAIRTSSLLEFVRILQRRLKLRNREFNICLVNDEAIRRLNLAYRGKDKATDVLSFPWTETERTPRAEGPTRSPQRKGWGIRNFLGDVVVSVPSARRNAQKEGHSILNEIRWLTLHGVLHLMGHDHARDRGEMTALELTLREQLGLAGRGGKDEVRKKNVRSKGQKAIRSRR